MTGFFPGFMLKDFYNEGHIDDPAIIGVSVFDLKEDFGAVEGTKKQFKRRNFLLLAILVVFKCLFLEHLPGIVDIVLTILILILIMEGLFYFFVNLNNHVEKKGILGALIFCLLLFLLLLIFGML